MEELESRLLLSGAPISFGNLTAYNSGQRARHIAVGDFNGDGFQDVAVANRNSNSISIFINEGNGTFLPAVTYRVLEPENIVAGDFLGNGKIDLAVDCAEPNNADGTGAPPVNLTNGNGTNNGTTDDGLSLFLGNGDGTFNPTPIDYRIRNGTHSMVVGDFNHDGLPDIAITAQFNVAVTMNEGNGVFAPQTVYKIGDAIASFVTAADLNNDANEDLIVARGNTSKVKILFGNGDGTFTLDPNPINVGGINPISIVAADFNNDGNMDLAVAGNGFKQGIKIILGNGDGTFQAPSTVPFTGFFQSITGGDFNNDGDEDLVAVDFTSSLQVFVGNGDGTFEKPVREFGGPEGAFAVGVDLTNDGKLDLLFTRHSTLYVQLNTTP